MSEFNIEDLEAVIAVADSSLVQMMALQLRRELEDSAKLREQLEESQREFRSADITMQNLEAKCEKLAAENLVMKQAIDQHRCGFVVCPSCSLEISSSTDDVCYVLDETPAAEAFLAEVRASAIDSIVVLKTKQLDDMHPDTHAFGSTAMSIRNQINELQVFAAQLRKGVQS